MMQGIDDFARLLNIPMGGTLKLARDISRNQTLLSVYQLSAEHKLELYLFLFQIAIVEGKVRPRLPAVMDRRRSA